MIETRPAWQLHAKCSGLLPIFWPTREYDADGYVVERMSNAEVNRAKDICWGRDGSRACPVRAECLEYAVDNEERHGVWGGTSEKERKGLIKRRQEAKWAARKRELHSMLLQYQATPLTSNGSWSRANEKRVSSAG